MANLDNLLGSHLSLISQQDVRYDGILFSINAKESSIVLRDVKCLGTEDRVTEAANVVTANPAILAFVTFPGHEIKDLYVHEATPAATADTPPPAPKQEAQQTQKQPAKASSQQRKPNDKRANPPEKKERPPAKNPSPAISPPPAPSDQPPRQQSSRRESGQNKPVTPGAAAGTGAHLLKMREKKIDSGAPGSAAEDAKGEFDFEAGLSSFNKEEVLATVAVEATAAGKVEPKYKKDDFFDSLSCDLLDRAEGRSTRMNAKEERNLNQDTFGATALQSSYRRGGYRGGGRGGGGRGGGGGGRGRGGGRWRGRGGGGGRESSGGAAVAAH